ncbi:MAG: hypothetical protein HRT61_24460, partial [Ekhidna sp.]|nr:hypothetical protein [Ekhidna sp.]
QVSGLMFDTGFNGGLAMPSSLAASFPSSITKTFIDRSTAGIYGSNTDTLIEKSLTLQIGNDSNSIPIEFSSLGKGLLGNDFLEHFLVTINNDENQITLTPSSPVEVSPGYAFVPGVLSEDLWVVNRVNDQQTSLTLGDTLAFINGLAPKDLFSTHCEYFMNIGNLLSSDSVIITKSDNRSIRIK